MRRPETSRPIASTSDSESPHVFGHHRVEAADLHVRRPSRRTPAPRSRGARRRAEAAAKTGRGIPGACGRRIPRRVQVAITACARRRTGAQRRQMLDRGDAAQAIGQPLQQRQAVVAHRGVVDVHHHLVEERIDLRAQARQAAEHGDVVARLQRASVSAIGRIDGIAEIALGAASEKRAASTVGGHVAFDLRRMLRMRLLAAASASASGSVANSPIALQAAVEVEQRRRAAARRRLRTAAAARPGRRSSRAGGRG